MTHCLFACCGFLAAFAHAMQLARTVRSRSHSVAAALLRVVPVAAVLLLAACSGALIAASAGWIAGWMTAAPLCYRRLRP